MDAVWHVTDDEEWLKKLGANVRVRRKAAARSQEDLADQVGVDVRYLGGIERGQENPSVKVMRSIAKALQVDLKDLFN